MDMNISLNLYDDEDTSADEAANLLLRDSPTAFDLIPKILAPDAETRGGGVNVSTNLWEDSGLEKWARESTITLGGGHALWNVIQSPTTNLSTLRQRQTAIQSIHESTTNHLRIAHENEKHVLWALNMPDMKDAWPINALFPSAPVARLINYVPPALELFQIYKANLLPWISLAFPISTFIGPWLYVKNKLHMNISFKKYCKFLWMALKAFVSPVKDDIQANIYKYASLFLYISFYIYGIVQSFQTSMMLNKIRTEIATRMDGIRTFIAQAHSIMSLSQNAAHINTFDHTCDTKTQLQIRPGMSGFYCLMVDKTLQDGLKMLCRVVWMADVCVTSQRILNTRKCTFVRFANANANANANTNTNTKTRQQQTKFWGMGHICLDDNQVRNPVSLKKSLIVTGPNAAGKTTYVRSLLTNIILSQTLGMAYAKKGIVRVVDALGTFMRISDVLGSESLFEAEVHRCAELITQAEHMSAAGKTATYFLDEPMHSTPPTEGSATSRAVIEYIGGLPGIRVIVTTHYHDLTSMKPELFYNVSMDAISLDDGTFNFPYKIHSGPSFKCIALELLDKNKLPAHVVAEAIRIKEESQSQLRQSDKE